MATEMEEYRLERLLQNRVCEPASADFLDTVVRASYSIPQKPALRLFSWLDNLSFDWMLPRPALSFALLLAVGVGVGLLTPLPDEKEGVLADAYMSEGDVL